MIRPTRRDPARIRDALGIQPVARATVDDALAALAVLTAKRAALGTVTSSPYPPNATPEERFALASAVLDELVRSHRPAPSWGL